MQQSVKENLRSESVTTPTPNKWLVAAAVIVPTTLEMVDTTVVNVALPHIQGNLNASVDEVAWVLTSYLIANGVVIPLTGWLSGLWGRKRFFLTCIVLFTLSSFLCGAAPNLPFLVLCRTLQGASGAALIPLSQAILLETFPPEEHGVAMAVWGIGVMVAPIIAPLFGGWITDNYSWRWAFYINVPLGGVALLLAAAFIVDPSYLRRAQGATDYLGLALLIVGLVCLQLVLDRGERADWFAAIWVWVCTAVGVAAVIAFVFWELRTAGPIVDFRLLTNRTYAIGTMLHTVMGFVLYSSIMLQPLFAQTLMGYDALTAGYMLLPGGFCTLLMMPLVGVFMHKFDPRVVLTLGMGVTSVAVLLMSWRFTLDAGMWQLIQPRIVWGIGMGFFFVPLSAVTLGAISKEKMGYASALFNLMRNIGGSCGIALAVTLLGRRAQVHQHILVEHVSLYNPEAVERLRLLWQGLMLRGVDSVTAQAQAGHLLYGEVQRQALMMAFLDNFWLIGLIALACLPLILLMRKASGVVVAGH